jgi:hypothetical protein
MSVPLASFVEPRFSPLAESEKVTVQGRFFFVNDEKFFLKGVTSAPSHLRVRAFLFPRHSGSRPILP